MTVRFALDNIILTKDIASLTKDRECVACQQDGEEANPGCTKHRPFDMPNDHAVETLHGLIDRARELCK